MLPGPLLQLVCVLASVFVAGCGEQTAPEQRPAMEWHTLPWPGGSVRVALVRPENEGEGPHPVVFALPWGSGSAELVRTFVQSYWLTEPSRRGYYVVAPEVRGSTLVDTADELIPAIFEWMTNELDFDAERVALAGASNGGRGLFFAAIAQPNLFDALLGLPASFTGDPADLEVLAAKPIRLLVGEFDDGWVASGQATVAALRSQGADVELEIVPGEGHVMRLDPVDLLDWIDAALAR